MVKSFSGASGGNVDGVELAQMTQPQQICRQAMMTKQNV